MQRRARRHADAHELIGWINVFETQKRDNRKRERERERAQKMSPSISRQQLGNRKRSTRMKRNFLADEEKEQTRGKLKKKKERKEKKGRKNSFWERILYASQPRCPLRGLVDDSYQFTFSFDSRIQHHCDQFVLYFRVVCQAKVNDPCAVV